MSALAITAIGLAGLAMLFLTYACSTTGIQSRATDGRRGTARQHALANSPWSRALDPLLRRMATWTEPALPRQVTAWIDRRLSESGYCLGLLPSEWVALCLLSTAGGTLLGASCATILDDPAPYTIAGSVLGCAFPWLRLRGVRAERRRRIAHELPAAIDLAGLCMGAGLDFAASLEIIVEQAANQSSPLLVELRHLVRLLHLGRTRSAALADLGRAAPIPCVLELVAAVQQAERKGTPLSHVLTMQAQMLRRRRGLAAEEAAARAAVLLVLPLLLLMGCVMLIMFAPFIINGFGL